MTTTTTTTTASLDAIARAYGGRDRAWALNALLSASGFESDERGHITRMPPEFGGVRLTTRGGDDAAAEVEVVDLAASPFEVPDDTPVKALNDDDDDDDDACDDDDASESDIPPLSERLGAAREAREDAGTTSARAPPARRWTEDERADALTTWIRANEDVYERILLMESIDVDDCLGRAREGGIRCSRADFIAYLEAEGVCFSQTKKRARRAANAR